MLADPLSLWQEALLLGLAGLSLIYVFYFRIWTTLAVGSDLLFAAALALTIAGITYPPLFEAAADTLIVRSPLPEALRAADAKVAEIEALPSSLIDRALAKLGVEPDADKKPEGGRPEPQGPFVETVRPSIDALISTSLRLTGFACGSFLMLTSLAMRSSTTTARKFVELSRRIEELEARGAHDEKSRKEKADPSEESPG